MLERNRPFIKVDVTENINQKFDTINQKIGEHDAQLADNTNKIGILSTNKANVSSKNLYNRFDLEFNTYINETNGNSTHSNLFHATRFIPVNPSTTYTISHKNQGAYYDVNKNYISAISGANNNTKQTFTTPSNARYIRVSVPVSYADVFAINEGSDITDSTQIDVKTVLYNKDTCFVQAWNIKLLANKTYQLDYKSLIRNNNNVNFRILKAPAGTSLKENVIVFNNVDISQFSDFQWEIQDLAGNVLENKTIKIVGNSSKLNQIYFNMIGDSLTMEPGTVQGLLNELTVNCRSVGIRTFDNGNENHEGRGGWKIEDYTTRFGRTDGLDSPFLFPVGIAGNKYFGNTAFWKYIVNNPNTTVYDYKGFDLIAKDWYVANPYQYDANGYRLNPSIGDTMIDPTKPAGQQIVQFDGTSWVPLSPQPSVEINYSKYVQRFTKAFADGSRNPNMVAIMVGTNNLQQRSFNGNYSFLLTELKKLTDSILAYNPNMKFIICIPPTSGSQDKWGDAVGIGMTKWEFDKNVQGWASYLFSNYWQLGIPANNLEICNMIGVLQPSDYADWLHPLPTSRYKIGQWIAGYAQWLR